ncbi:possible cytosine deaminase [Prochlorococcus marinus str. MIT 9515]|uniref:Possible cytosine deaminase n=1 Tax=Prochlorococcus marinus (strain MIT 9515) TaxID=167542 RepID=A2BY11_PROM5|nr:amidohydrolase family protein [Prochlorococcus marinus]ABM72672.1 possible cytosine deaminase [Prochlorococcus marinus str. MIT 9515]
MNTSGNSEVLIPRCLCEIEYTDNLNVDLEDLASVFVAWEKGIVSELKPINIENTKPKKILFPRFVETHSHLDKSFTWQEFPNFKSNYEEALSVNLEEHITRTTEKVLDRAERSLNLALKNGYRAIRSHIDTSDAFENDIWSELFNLQKKYSSKLKLQFVALSPLEFWDTTNGEELAKKFSKENGILGGVLVPPFKKAKVKYFLSKMLLLADKYNLEIDLHIDESNIEPGAGIKVLLETIEKLNIKVPITCSHLSSILSLKDNEILNLGRKIADKNIKVIALPLTNFWLLNRNDKSTSLNRPVAPIKQLQKSLVDVSIGSDNVQDPWYSFGSYDPFYLMTCAMPMLQLSPWERLTLSSMLLAPSRLLNLSWDGLIKKGCPADFVIVDAEKWADIFSSNLKKDVIIKGELYS